MFVLSIYNNHFHFLLGCMLYTIYLSGSWIVPLSGSGSSGKRPPKYGTIWSAYSIVVILSIHVYNYHKICQSGFMLHAGVSTLIGGMKGCSLGLMHTVSSDLWAEINIFS